MSNRHCDYCDSPVSYEVSAHPELIHVDAHQCRDGVKAHGMSVPAENFYYNTHESFECPYNEDLPLEMT